MKLKVDFKRKKKILGVSKSEIYRWESFADLALALFLFNTFSFPSSFFPSRNRLAYARPRPIDRTYIIELVYTMERKATCHAKWYFIHFVENFIIIRGEKDFPSLEIGSFSSYTMHAKFSFLFYISSFAFTRCKTNFISTFAFDCRNKTISALNQPTHVLFFNTCRKGFEGFLRSSNYLSS